MSAANEQIRPILRALQERDRGLASSIIRELLAREANLGDQWLTVGKLAAQIGEKSLALEASDNFGRLDLTNPERLLIRAGLLAELGNLNEALAWIEPLVEEHGEMPILLHFCGTAHSQLGHLETALEYLRRALHVEPMLGQTWLTLSALKSFTEDDSEYRQLEALYSQMATQSPINRAPYLYALGKARADIGNHSGAFTAYSKGAKLKKRDLPPFQFEAETRQVKELISTLDRKSLDSLEPNQVDGSTTIFVIGWPRSGSTLIEQILTSHSKVSDGGEVNLFGQAHLEVGGLALPHLQSYAAHFAEPVQAWQRVNKTFSYLLGQRFGQHQILVDKSLNNGRFLGSIYLTQPNAPIIWIDRSPIDAAWSCFHTYFNKGLAWSYSLEEIGQYFKLERSLFEHWQAELGDRILRVPYEDLVTDPNSWISKIFTHCLLEPEPSVWRFYETERAVQTASIAQVRRPLNKLSIGAAQPYLKWMQPFGRSLVTTGAA